MRPDIGQTQGKRLMRRGILTTSLSLAFLFASTGIALEAHLHIAHSDCCGHEHSAPAHHDDCQVCVLLRANVKTTADLPDDAPVLVETSEPVILQAVELKPQGCTFGEPAPRGPPFA